MGDQAGNEPGRVVNVVWRTKVVQWYYDFVDNLSESRSVVYVAVNVLDRFCSAVPSAMDERTFELAALASLFLAVRISGTMTLELDYLVSTSRLSISIQDIVKAGTMIINTLDWDEKIQTPQDCVHRFVTLVPTKGARVDRQQVLDVALYVVEIGLCDYCLSRSQPAELGAAAILIALGSGNQAAQRAFSEALYLSESIKTTSPKLAMIHQRLFHAYQSNANAVNENGPAVIEDDEQDAADGNFSPTTPLSATYYSETTFSDIHIIPSDI